MCYFDVAHVWTSEAIKMNNGCKVLTIIILFCSIKYENNSYASCTLERYK